jgi:threonine dehydrogenase-like Zn-dependent dehydrogenase
MKAVCWNGAHEVKVEEVPDPQILNPRDAIVKVSTTAICGSDLHLYDGYIPTMKRGDILGHEFMGEIVEVGSAVQNLNQGDRVVVPFTISCGNCFYCKQGEFSLCDNSNPKGWISEKMFGHACVGIFGYSHMMGGYAGGQAEYVRVPFADVGPIKIPEHLTDEQSLFLSDILPTGWQAAVNCDIKPGDVVAVWGCGPVGQFAILAARLLGAGRVIAIDYVPERLEMARTHGGAEVLNHEEVGILEALREMTGGRGPDACIDAVGMEAHGEGPIGWYDKAKQLSRMQTDRPTVLREAIQACRKGGTISIPGVYGGVMDKVNFGAAFNKSLTLKMGQTHVQKYMPELLGRIERGEFDPSFVITHRLALDEAPRGYDIFRKKEENCIKVVMKPGTLH